MKLILLHLGLIFSLVLSQSAIVIAQDDSTEVNSDTLEAEKELFVKSVKTEYVVYKGDSLFEIKANLGPYSPFERSGTINERIKLLAQKEKKIEVDSFQLLEVNNYTVIAYKDKAIMSVGEADVSNLNKSRVQLANEYLRILKTLFTKESEKNTLLDWLRNIGFTLLAVLGLFIIFRLQKKLFDWANLKLTQYEKDLTRKRKSVFKYLIPKESSNVLIVVSKIVKFGLTILILFLYLPFLFSFLPWTKGLAGKFYGYIADPITKILTGFVNFIPNLFSIIVIIIIARYLLRMISYVSKEIEDDKLKIKGFHRDWARPTFNLVKITIYVLAVVFSVQYLPSSSAFKGVSIFVGVLVTFGSTSAIANMIAGVVITYMRPFVIGDRVKIGNTIGDVVEKNLLVTRLLTPKNEDVTIPNATIINTQLWNYSKNAHEIGIILHPTVTIGYDVPSELVTKLLLKAAKNTKNLTREFKPFVLQKGLNDFYVEYELNVYTKQPKKMLHFYSELYKSILNEFNEAGVEILSPHYSNLRDGNTSTIPGVELASNPVEKVMDKIKGK